METLRRVLKGIDTFTRYQGYALVPFCLLLIVITMYDIVGRQLGIFTAWAFDSEWFLYGFLMMMGMGYASLQGQHVRVDLAGSKLSPRMQSLFLVISFGVFVIPVLIIVGIDSWNFAMRAKKIGENVVSAWDFPLWPVKFSIFAGCCLMLPHSVAELIRHIYFVIRKEKL